MRFATKYPWSKIGRCIIKCYLAGEVPAQLSTVFNIPVSAITAYIGRTGHRRSGKEAKAVARQHGRINTTPRCKRICPACKEKFQPKGPNQQRCKECIPNARFKEYYNRYGITKKDWDQIFKAQNGTCALCPAPPDHVDHQHETGVVRGLLCGGCNRALSHVDRPAWLKRATAYIKNNDTGHRVNPKEGYWNAWRAWHEKRDVRQILRRAARIDKPHRTTSGPSL